MDPTRQPIHGVSIQEQQFPFQHQSQQKKLGVQTNGGTQISSQIRTIKNFGDVWYNPKSLANILSMAAVHKVCRIKMDTDTIEAAIIVERKDKTVMKLVKEYRSGLHYYDVVPNKNYLFLNTVAGNKAQYTQREIEGAKKARALYKDWAPIRARIHKHPKEQSYQKLTCDR